ncbi:hypothetical protein GCM10009111_10860 [Colwellia asteriadis]|uniref:Lipoprotein n=1 Tax=Colwellia asteriadis TaxID=517723 RepID=A0ABN1L4X2_9GAMM
MGRLVKSSTATLFLSIVLSGCGGGGGGGESEGDGGNTFPISGTIQGLDGEIHLMLHKNDQSWNSGVYSGNGVANVSFTIGEFEQGVNYKVTVEIQPENQNCIVENSSGKVSKAVSNILIKCSDLATQQTGYFIDSPVEGLSYYSNTFEGVTNFDGSFEYMSDESVTFVLGGTEFNVEQLPAGAIVSPLSLFNTNSTADQRVINLARLLQTLDVDGNADNGITLDTELINQEASIINFDVTSQEFGNDASILAFVQAANPSQNITALIGAEQAKAHLDAQLALVNSCALDRTFELASHESIISTEAGVRPKNIGLSGSTLTISKTGACELSAPEGWSGSCNISGANITVAVGGDALSGTLSNNSVTLVAMPTLSDAGQGGKEYVSVYFNGTSSVNCPAAEVVSGSYSYAGKEAAAALDGSGFDVYDVNGTLTLSDDSCEFSSTEGSGACQVNGNEVFGLGDASGLRGTITNNQLTMYFNSPGNDGELVVGYFSGSRN